MTLSKEQLNRGNVWLLTNRSSRYSIRRQELQVDQIQDAVKVPKQHVRNVVQTLGLASKSQLSNRRTQKIGILAIAIEGIHPARKSIVLAR